MNVNNIGGVLSLASPLLSGLSSTHAKGTSIRQLSASGTEGDSDGTTSLNLHDISTAQLLAAAQSKGMTNVTGFLATAYSSMDGSPVSVADVASQTGSRDLIADLQWDAQNSAAHGGTSQGFMDIAKTLLSQADPNGNITVNSSIYQKYLAYDAGDNSTNFDVTVY